MSLSLSLTLSLSLSLSLLSLFLSFYLVLKLGYQNLAIVPSQVVVFRIGDDDHLFQNHNLLIFLFLFSVLVFAFDLRVA
jgi:hypothetical protein